MPMNILLRYRVFLWSAFFLFCVPQVSAQTASVRGFVTDASDGQALQGVNIALRDATGNLRGGSTDDDGFFIVVRLQPGRWFLQASFIGYETFADTLDLTEDRTERLSISLRPGVELDAVVVEGEREGGAMVAAGVQTVRPADVDLVPTPDVSGDLVSYLSAMPGVVSIGDRGGQVFIRGGEPSHNLALLDGMYIYQPFHILGFYSAFSSDILRNADIHAGAFSSKYSGRMSSVIDVHTRNGNLQESRRTFSFAPFVSMGILEGPVKRGRMSYLLSGRASTIERVASGYINQPVPYTFGDFFGKVHWTISDSHQASVSAIHTYDRGTLDTANENSDEIRWNNTAYGARWLVVPPNLPMLGEVLFSVSILNMERGPKDEPDRSSAIEGFNLTVNLTNYGQRTNVDWGFYLRAPRLDASLDGLFQNLDFTSDRILSTGAYFEPEISFTPNLKGRLGLIAEFLGDQGFHFEPRIRVLYELGPHQFSIAGGFYRQEMVGLNDRRDATNVFTAWTGSPTGSLPNSIHGLIGYSTSLRPGVNVSAELFYKNFSSLFVSEWTAFPRFTTRLQEASGRAMGIDLRMELRKTNFYGFVNYGLSSVEYNAMQETLPVWFGSNEVRYRPPHDRRHQINALLSFTWKKFDFSARWNFGSGLPYSQIRGFDGFILMDGPVDVAGDLGAARVIYDRPYEGLLPSYHRLDLSIDRVFQYRDDSFVTAQVGVINVYNKSNLFSLDVFTAERNNQLPIIPTAGIKFEF
ncbi:MAG: TonB-dependent receptor [Rhodothermaceae bacterium]|nr:TonB-dependent receptor [Rhodothermaceae bacterium]MYH13037.1 TonB-dependent receptor [Rhodothermaceae bacterium]MYK62816.1 TonB-dependent receptor [Rhodothermaceae bacterium]